MTESTHKSRESRVTVRLKKLLKDISAYVDSASEDQKQRLLDMLKDWRESDRRKYPRKPCSITITCTVKDRTFTDIIRNICPGGAFLETSETFSVGEQITLGFSSPDREQPIKIHGQVAWSAPKGIGVKFRTPRKDLERMIESL